MVESDLKEVADRDQERGTEGKQIGFGISNITVTFVGEKSGWKTEAERRF